MILADKVTWLLLTVTCAGYWPLTMNETNPMIPAQVSCSTKVRVKPFPSLEALKKSIQEHGGCAANLAWSYDNASCYTIELATGKMRGIWLKEVTKKVKREVEEEVVDHSEVVMEDAP